MAYVAGASYVAGKGITAGQWALLDVIRGIIATYASTGRKYCFPSQQTLLEKLDTFHGIAICRKTLNNWLRKLERAKLIYRKRRLTRGLFRSTAYYLLDRGGYGLVKAKKIIGQAKRLASVFPKRVQKVTHDRHTTKCHDSGGRPQKKAAPAPVETKRCEASDLRKDLSAPAASTRPEDGKERPASMVECMEKVLGLDRARLLRKTRPFLE
ncbi:MAG: hypothetical protein H3C68_01445 [Deltaproteobacteria bacterium]|nr:hypothetical protein [Deltaproteobacteria bacterium]MBZ0219082.1 hypothetical protein [Deltaproteobacteria bacterium]